MGLKKVVGSQRPNGQDSLSFPSGHTAGAFTWATTISHYYGLESRHTGLSRRNVRGLCAAWTTGHTG